MTPQPHHLLTLWNPSYAADAVGEHLSVLLDWAGRWRSQFADFWFRLWDIRRLVAGDTAAVIEELKRLRNTRYHDRPVSL